AAHVESAEQADIHRDPGADRREPDVQCDRGRGPRRQALPATARARDRRLDAASAGDVPRRAAIPHQGPDRRSYEGMMMSNAHAYDGGTPRAPRPIVIVGAGGIVRDAHLPAYRKAEFPVWGIVDVAPGKARELADQYGIVHVFESVHEAVAQAPDDAVYDLALMPEHVPEVLAALPEGSPVLIQKPLGHSLEQ